MRVLVVFLILFVTGSLGHNAGYHRLRVVNAMYNSQTLIINITQDGEIIKTFILGYKVFKADRTCD